MKKKTKDEAMDMLKEYFFSLWDQKENTQDNMWKFS